MRMDLHSGVAAAPVCCWEADEELHSVDVTSGLAVSAVAVGFITKQQ